MPYICPVTPSCACSMDHEGITSRIMSGMSSFRRWSIQSNMGYGSVRPQSRSPGPAPVMSAPARRPGSVSEVLTEIILANSTVDWGLASVLSGGLCCAAMISGTALRHTRIGDPVLF
jgi:hypothetical protein